MTRLRELSHVKTWLATPLERDVESSLVRLATSSDVARMAVLPDVHLSPGVCVGVAIATTRLIYPAAVGGDIGCGMLALRFRADASCLQHEAAAAQLLAGLYRRVPSLKHSAATCPAALSRDLVDTPLSHPLLEKLKARDARLQLGTLGRGNHFVEFQSDEAGELWVLLHSGSRGMGQAITAHHLRSAETPPGAGLISVAAESDAGRAYLADQEWARRYAANNRLTMLESIVDILQQQLGIEPDRDSLVHSDHNHVQQETHEGKRLWVHRKGTQLAAPDVQGIIPGSMGTATYHVTGRGNCDALNSSSHGAGRIKSRTEARHSTSISRLRREVRDVWVDEHRLADLKDEAPSAYRDIHQVIRAQQSLVKVTRTLWPLLNYKR